VTTQCLVGVDIGGSKCAVVVGSDAPRILDRESFATDKAGGPAATLERVYDLIPRLCSRAGIKREEVTAIGVSCGGPLDSARGVILSPPNLPGWDQVEIVRLLEERFSLPTFLQNDADACALAEWRWGAGRGLRNLVFLTFGTGMGAGLILDGRLYSGTNGMAGEVGHLRLAEAGPVGYGKAGSFEGFCSGGGIALLASAEVRRRLERGERVDFCPNLEQAAGITAREVVLAAEAGDPVAAAIIRESASYLGRALAILVDLLNPEVIVIGSIFSRAEALFRAPMEAALAAEALDRSRRVCSVVPALLGEEVGDYASLCVAMEGASSREAAFPG